MLNDGDRSNAHHEITIGFKLMVRCIERSRLGHGLRNEQPIKRIAMIMGEGRRPLRRKPDDRWTAPLCLNEHRLQAAAECIPALASTLRILTRFAE